MKLIAAAMTLVLWQQDCDFTKKPEAKSQASAISAQIPATISVKESARRFEVTRNLNIAFDTQTGQLCRTWEWVPLARNKSGMDYDQHIEPLEFGEFQPTCAKLYTEDQSKEIRYRVVNGQIVPQED